MTSKIFKILLPIFVFGLSLAVYAFTLAPSITAGDSTEMVNIALTLGIAHPQSYPFVAVIGHLFSLLPFGPSPVWRVNLMSAFFEALTNMVVYFIILSLYKFYKTYSLKKDCREEITDYFLAASASLFLGFSLIHWQLATKAEVFALNNFLSVLVIFLGLSFFISKKWLWFWLTVLVGGLAFSHHQTAILIAPAIAFLIFLKDKIILLRRKTWLFILLFFVIGLIPYFVAITNLARSDPPLNWGNPSTVMGAAKALARTDFGSFAYLKEAKKGGPTETAIDQFVYYFKTLIDDFTLWGGLLMFVGGFFLWKQGRKVFFFLIIGITSMMIFLAYAQFSMGSPFSQATLRRFHLLPNIFIAFFIAFGLYYLWQKFNSLKLDFKQPANRFARILVFLLLSFAFLIPLTSNYSRADNKNNWGTLRYAQDFYQPTEPNAIIMVAGDVAGFCGQYEKFIDFGGDDRIVFSPGQFHLKWFIPQLTSRYPDLIIPPPLPGNRFTVTHQVIEANLGKRPIYINPELAFHDPEVEKRYVLWPKGLLFLIGNKGGEKKLEPYQEKSDWLWQSLDMEWFSWVKKNNPMFEDSIVGYYAQHFHNLGYMYDSVKLYEDSIREYERALEIDPNFEESIKNLGLLYGFKTEPINYQLAINYLSRYLALVEKKDPEAADSTRYTISKIYEENNKELERMRQEEATMSGEMKDDDEEEE